MVGRDSGENENAGVDRIVLVAPPGMETFFEKEASNFRKEMEVCVVAGGDSRRDSVLFGLKAAKEDMVMIHDAARPFVSVVLCRRIMGKAGEEGSAIPVLPVTDALKAARGGVIISSVPREDLLATQTPQAYPVEEIGSVLEKTPGKIRDEAEAWLASGRVPGWVRGDPFNFKITFPEDLEMARRMVRGAENVKTGLGFDVHPLVPGVPLVLGGVRIPFSLGLSAHPTGTFCHAVAGAILGPRIFRHRHFFPHRKSDSRASGALTSLRKSWTFSIEGAAGFYRWMPSSTPRSHGLLQCTAL